MPERVLCALIPPQKWADTETTTALWRAISSGDKEALETLLDADEETAHVRAADGRGPLWCVCAAVANLFPSNYSDATKVTLLA